jgi:hypothetical protein
LKSLAFIIMTCVSAVISAEPFFPEHQSCRAGKDIPKSCEITLSENGYIVDVATGNKISDTPEPTGAMNTISLYKYGNKYILENQNYSSGKTRQWIAFKYSDKKITLERIYVFSQAISMISGPKWHGYECRNSTLELVNQAGLALSEAAIKLVCGDIENIATELKQLPPPFSTTKSLAITIPIYTDREIHGAASYLFVEVAQPDMYRMICYSNCGLPSKPNLALYIGRIAKSAWFKSGLQVDGCQSKGSYTYKNSSEEIIVSGCIKDGGMALTEYFPGTQKEHAIFSGDADGDGYKGIWSSKSGDNKKYNYFMYPLTIY